MISNGLRLAALGTLEAPNVTAAFGKVMTTADTLGKMKLAKELDEKKLLTVPLTEVPGYNANARAEFVAALGELKNLELPHIARLERDQDQPISVIMAGLTLERHLQEGAEDQVDYYLKPHVSQLKVPIFAQPRDMLNPFRIEKEIALQRSLDFHATRCAMKKGLKGKAVVYGIGAAHLPRSDGVPVSVATVDPKDAAILQQLQASKDEAMGEGCSPISRSWSF